MSRPMYEAIVPWWEIVASGGTPDDGPELSAADRDFAALLAGLTKVVFSTTLAPADGRVVIAGDLAAELATLKGQDGKDIIVSCGPATLGPLAAAPGLIDEYLLAVHPAVVGAGPGLFDGLSTDLALELVSAKSFPGGAVVLRHRVVPA